MGLQTVPLPELLTNLRERELLLSIPLSMKPTLLFAFCALVTLVSSAPAQAPQHNPAQAEVAALITEVRAQQAAIAANQVKINEKLATLAESIRVARIYSSRGGREANTSNYHKQPWQAWLLLSSGLPNHSAQHRSP